MKKILLAVVVLAVVAIIAPPAGAETITFALPSGATETGGNPVSATATFVTSADTLTITLNNTEVNPNTVAQNISGLSFTITTGQTGGTLTSSSGTSRTVNNNKTYTDAGSISTGWKLTTGLELLCDIGCSAAGPADTIIGLPASSNTYAAAGGSIAGNGPHNPFLFGPVTFTLDIPGLTADSSITNVEFFFGTTAGDGVSAPPPVPEPASLVLLGTGLIGLGSVARRKWFR